MKKILFLTAFMLLGTTIVSCDVTNQKDNEFADNGSFGTDDNPIPFKPTKPTLPPPPPPVAKGL